MAPLCRICGQESEQTQELFDKDNFEILNNVLKLTGIWLTRSLGAPTVICLSCLLDLNDAVVFRDRCIKTNSLWTEEEDNQHDMSSAVRKREQPSNRGCSPKPIALKIVPISKGLNAQKGFLQRTKLPSPSSISASCDPMIQFGDRRAVSNAEFSDPLVINTATIKVETDTDTHFGDNEELLLLKAKPRSSSKSSLSTYDPICTLVGQVASSDLDPIGITTESIKVENEPLSDDEDVDSVSQTHSKGNDEIVTLEVQPRSCLRNGESKHEGELAHKMNKFFCDQCGKEFKEKGNFKMHMVRHTGIKSFECPDCGKREFSAYLMNIHIRVKHRDEKPYSCKYCGESFVTSTKRCRHQSLLHEMKAKNKRFQCTICDLRFETQSEMKKHGVVHSGERNFHCEICRVSFTKNTHLKAHFRSIQHTKKATEKSKSNLK